MDDLVAIAKVIRPRGLKGEVFAELLTDFPERFDGLEDVTAVSPDGEPFDIQPSPASLEEVSDLIDED